MKTIKYLAAGLTLFSLGVFASGDMAKKSMAKSYKVDASNSKVVWLGKKVSGKHTGTINLKSGSLKYNGTELTGGEVVIDMTTINTTDLSGEWKKKLDDHLKNTDFFATNKFKTAKLVIKSAMFGKGGHWDVNGELTIKGITKPIMFKVDIVKKGSKLIAKTKLKFNRLDYGVKYNSGKFFENLGDKLIYDEVELDVNLTAI